jgi:adenylylsulfate kinase
MKRYVNRETARPAPGANIVRQTSVIRMQRESANEHRGAVVWLTGQPGSGKSTNATKQTLYACGMRAAILDGDNMRLSLCTDLDFSKADRDEHVRRVTKTARLLLQDGAVVIVALVSPCYQAREHAKQSIGAADLLEVHCSYEPAVCKQRDLDTGVLQARACTTAKPVDRCEMRNI